MNKFIFVLSLFFLSATFSWASGKQDGRILEHFNYPSQVKSIEIQTDRHDVSVSESTEGVSGRLIGESNDDYDIKLDGSKLTITVSTKKFWFWGSHRPGLVEIKIPQGLTVKIVTASGDVELKARTEKLSVLTASGKIIAENGGTSAQLETSSGDITTSGFQADLKAVSYSGNIDASKSKGTIDLNSLSGEIHTDSIGGTIVVSTTSGDIQIENSQGSFQIMSVSGSIEAQRIELDGNCRISTTSGNIQLKLTNAKEELTFSGSSMSGSVSAWGKKGSPLHGGSGKIDLNVNSVSGSLSIE